MAGIVQVDVQVAPEVSGAPPPADIRHWLERAIAHVGADEVRDIEVSVRVVGEDEGRSLNRQYRDRDAATNVLSFPLMDDSSQVLPEGVPRALGDIVVCEPVVRREASEQGCDYAHHWAHMLVHGALHLVGYDHESEPQAIEMESLESHILSTGGVPDPYAGAGAGS